MVVKSSSVLEGVGMMSDSICTGSDTAPTLHSCGSGRRGWDTCCSELCTAEAVHSTSQVEYYKSERPQRNNKIFSTAYTTVLYFQSVVGVMRAFSLSMSSVASTYSLISSGRGATFSSFVEFIASVLSCGSLCAENVQLCVCVNRLHEEER